MLNRAQWDALGDSVINQMRQHTETLVASVFAVHSLDEGSLLASGTYLRLRNKVYLLTNRHVATVLDKHPLAHQLADDEYVIRLSNPFQALSDPIDAALGRIDEAIWNSVKNHKQALPPSHLADEHKTVRGELLFIMGFSGERSHFSPSLGMIFSTGTPFLTQEASLTPPYLPNFHFALHYSGTDARSLNKSDRGLPVPLGFSGSLVWNTRAVECLRSSYPWTPHEARATGLVWGWDTKAGCLIATRIEHVRLFLLQAIRQEMAYFHWLQRGAPAGDDLTDWSYAVRNIPKLT
jgi:hypothetical protein